MKIKETVNLTGLRTETLLAIMIVNECYSKLNEEFVLTSVTDSVHTTGSLHYVGFAFDCRTKDLSIPLGLLTDKIKASLSPQFDIVIEVDHIHIEFQPKVKL